MVKIDSRLARELTNAPGLASLADPDRTLRVVALAKRGGGRWGLGFETVGEGFRIGERIVVSELPAAQLQKAVRTAELERQGFQAISLDDQLEAVRPRRVLAGGVPIEEFAFDELGEEIERLDERLGVAVVDDMADEKWVGSRGVRFLGHDFCVSGRRPGTHANRVIECGVAALGRPRGIEVLNLVVFAGPFTTMSVVLVAFAKALRRQDIDVVNASLSGPSDHPNPLYVHAAKALLQAGKVLVCAAGNDGRVGDPARSSPLCMGATTNDKARMTVWTARAEAKAIDQNFAAAPGEHLLVAGPDGEADTSGTSFSSPQACTQVGAPLRILRHEGLGPFEAATKALRMFKECCRPLQKPDDSPSTWELGGAGWGLPRQALLLRALGRRRSVASLRDRAVQFLTSAWEPWWRTLPNELEV